MSKKYFSKLGAVASYSLAYTLSATIQKGVGFFVFMFFANMLTTNEYAKFGISYSIFTMLSTLTFSGILESVVSLMREHKSNNGLNGLFKAANSVFIMLSILGSLLLAFIILIFYKPNFENFFDILAIILSAVLSSFFIFQSTIVQLGEKHLLSILLSSIPTLVCYIGGFIAVLFLKTGVAYFLGAFLGYLFLVLLIFPFTKNNFKGFSIQKSDILLITSRIAPYIIIATLSWILGYGNTFLIKYLFNDFQVALFVFLFTISSLILLVASSMNQVWAPRFFINYESTPIKILERKNKKFTTIQGLILGLVGFSIIVIFPLIANNFQKLNKFSNTKAEMFFLFAGYIVSIPWWHAQIYFMINNKGRSLMQSAVLSGMIGYGIWILCMILMGSMGIYFGFFLQMSIRTIIIYLRARNCWKINFDWEGILLGITFLLIGFLIAH